MDAGVTGPSAAIAPPSPEVGPAVSADGLTRRYGERPALEDVSFSVPAGATLVVFGPNGAGKSTLLRVLATLLRPHGGSATVLGRDVRRDGWAVRGRIGFLGHDPLLYGDLSAAENLRYHARLHGLPGDAGERIADLLTATGLEDRAGDRVHTYSRGMVQRLAACRAVLHEPEVLLLDEPRANLDPAAAAALEPLIGRASGRTRIVTSHDPAGGLAEADLALGLRAGRAALLGDAHAITPGQVAELYSHGPAA
jgi:heme exporter protein A